MCQTARREWQWPKQRFLWTSGSFASAHLYLKCLDGWKCLGKDLFYSSGSISLLVHWISLGNGWHICFTINDSRETDFSLKQNDESSLFIKRTFSIERQQVNSPIDFEMSDELKICFVATIQCQLSSAFSLNDRWWNGKKDAGEQQSSKCNEQNGARLHQTFVRLVDGRLFTVENESERSSAIVPLLTMINLFHNNNKW